MKAKCKTCRGTGLFRHWADVPGKARECADCKGKGYVTVDDDNSYEAFNEKERVSDIKYVAVNAYGCLNNRGTHQLTYEEWFKGE